MKKLLLAGAFAALVAAPAVAADLKAPIMKAPPPVVVSTPWTGCYVGGNAGFGWAKEERESATAGFWFGGALPASDEVKADGAVYGGQVGCNWEAPSKWVFGLEFMGQGADLKETKTSVFFPASDVWSTRISSILQVTGRVGYDLNGWMPYVKGGVAFVDMKSRFQDNIIGRSVEEKDWYTGAVVGAGVEVLLGRNWTVGIEYSHIWADGKAFNSTRINTLTGLPSGATDAWSNDLNVSSVVGRLNYKFDWASPIIAKY
jgi:outer membrane immunogenic protein